MSLRLLSIVAAAAFVMAAPSPQASATAAKVPVVKTENSAVTQIRSRRHYRGHRGFRGSRHVYRRAYRHRGYRHSRRWRGPRVAIYAGPRWYGYRRAYRGCGWLRQRAIYSGSRYWWRRYNACRYGW